MIPGILWKQNQRNIRCPGYRFYPHKVKGEGFFVACFRKTEGKDLSCSTPASNHPNLIRRLLRLLSDG